MITARSAALPSNHVNCSSLFRGSRHCAPDFSLLVRLPRVGVGMTIPNHPLHRSGRALLTHPAPALGDDAKSPQGIRVMDSRRGQPPVDQAVHPLPRKPRPLAPSPQRPKPVLGYLKSE